MNNLSWLIFASNITENLSGFFQFVMVMSCIITFILLIINIVIFCAVENENSKPYQDEEYKKTYTEWGNNSRKGIKRCFQYSLAMFFLSGIIWGFTPNRQTVLLIAASEIGERIANNEKVQSVIDPSVELLKTWMTKETANLKSEMAKGSK
jgi:hypothetical protein